MLKNTTSLIDSKKPIITSQPVLVGNLYRGIKSLSVYKVKDVAISGIGNDITGATFDASTGVLTLTKGNFPTLSKGTDTSGTAKTLTFGGTFTAMTDTSVSGHTITDRNTTFTMPTITTTDLPDLTPTVAVTKESEGNVGVVVTVNGNSSTKATAQIMTPGNYVAKGGDTMTGPLVLSGDPTADLGAATKQYVDSAVSGLSGALLGSYNATNRSLKLDVSIISQ